MWLRISILLLLFFASLEKSQASNNAWSVKTIQDLNAMHQLIAENDPATAGYATRGFIQWYEPGLKQALKMAEKVNSYPGYFATLRFYANGFNSEHLNLHSLVKYQQAR